MSIRNANTKVYLYLNDYNAVCEEIYRHQRIETGGNLFGLWTTERNVVVHVPLGPGKNCKRTDVSFYQDIAYLSRVGSFLNKKFMLSRIGEWHSHNRLTLNEPSSGDKWTIRDNYPNGVKKFLVIIGNMVESGQISLSPYFFSENGNTCEKGILEVLDTHGPFTINETILNEMNEGAESPRQPIQNPSPLKVSQPSTSKVGASHPPSSGGVLNALKSGSGSPPADKNYLSISQTTPRSPSEPPTRTAQSSTQPSASNNSSIANSSSANEGDDGNKQTRKEVIMKKVFDEIKSRFEDSGVVIGGVMSGLIEMTFKHKKCHWFLKFPQSFPEKPARIFYSFSEKFSDAFECNCSKREFLNNHIDILLTIKNECKSSSTYCAPCRKVNVESLTQSNSTLDLFLTEEANATIKQLQDKAKETLHVDNGSLKKKMICDDVWKNAILEVSFTHSLMQWMIQVSSTFPSRPAKLYCKKVRSNYFGDSPNPVYYEMGRDSSKDWVSEILLAIAKRCDCVTCKRMKFT